MPSTPITVSSMVTAKPGLMASEVDGELVMMDADSGSYYGLDPVASAIWESVAEPASIDEIVARLMTRFEVDRATCEAETIAFVGQLRDAGLVTIG